MGVKKIFVYNGRLILVDLLTIVKWIVQFQELHVFFLQTAVCSTDISITFGVQIFKILLQVTCDCDGSVGIVR
jgi:hypothetical protein